jgi:hypothetical protein
VVQQVRGTGVMLGINLISAIATDIEQKVLLEYWVALWASTNKHCRFLTPPYAMTNEQFERVADALRKVLLSMASSHTRYSILETRRRRVLERNRIAANKCLIRKRDEDLALAP